MRPKINGVHPKFALPGGEIHLDGSGLMPAAGGPRVQFGSDEGSFVMATASKLVTRVPEDATGPLVLTVDGVTESLDVTIAQTVAENLHPVANPAVDRDGNIFVTFSGSRGQTVPIAVFKIDSNFNVTPYVNEMMNATGLALDSDGYLYISSRAEGTVYRVTPDGSMSTYAEGMGVATGIAFDHERNL